MLSNKKRGEIMAYYFLFSVTKISKCIRLKRKFNDEMKQNRQIFNEWILNIQLNLTMKYFGIFVFP